MLLPKFSEEESKRLFFTSDTHFFHGGIHGGIIEFCARPWKDVSTMNPAMVQLWNKKVPKDGKVFHLGDFAMTSNVELIESIVSQLNGKIYLVLGNHDYRNKFTRPVIKALFKDRIFDTLHIEVVDSTLKDKKIRFYMQHFPCAFWWRGRYHLHGHIHSGPTSKSSEQLPFNFRRYDVGVDNNDYAPVSYEELKEKLKILE